MAEGTSQLEGETRENAASPASRVTGTSERTPQTEAGPSERHTQSGNNYGNIAGDIASVETGASGISTKQTLCPAASDDSGTSDVTPNEKDTRKNTHRMASPATGETGASQTPSNTQQPASGESSESAGTSESGYSSRDQSTDAVFVPETPVGGEGEKHPEQPVDDVTADDVTGTPGEAESLLEETPSPCAGRLLPLPPDGGYGWVIVGASFLGNALVDGMCSAFGVFLPYFLEAFPGVGVGKMALAGSLMPCLFLTTGPVASMLINCWGCRVVTMAGGFITCVALLLATLSPNVDVLIVTYGALGGIGLALIYLPSMVMVGYYFERRRAMATGIASSGSGFGMLLLAPLAAYLVGAYHWKGALIIMSGIMLQGLVLGALMRPLEAPNQPASQSESELTEDDALLAGHASQSQPGLQTTHKLLDETGEVSNHQINASDENNSSKELYTGKGNESVQLYRKAIQNALSQKLSELGSDHQLESQQNLNCSDSSYSLKHLNSTLKNSGENLYLTSSGSAQVYGPHRKMSTTQSCYEFQEHAQTVRSGPKRTRANTESHYLAIPSHKPYTANSTVVAQSCHEIYAPSTDKSVHSLRNRNRLRTATETTTTSSSSRNKLAHELLNPLQRKDIFYSGSLTSLPEYRSQPNRKSYIASVTLIPDLDTDDVTADVTGACTCFPRASSALSVLERLVEPSIVRNPYFLVITLASVFVQIGYFIPIVYVVDYAVSLGSSTQEAAIIISVIGISNTIGRTLGGCLANLTWVNYLHLNNVTLLIAGCATMLVATACKTFSSLVVYAVILGFSVGPFASLTTIFLVDYLGLEKLTNSFGLLCMAKGLASIVGPPIAGVLLEATNSFAATFYFGGSMFVCSGLVYYLLPVVGYCSKNTDKLQPTRKNTQ